jgi:hypothetical protein
MSEFVMDIALSLCKLAVVGTKHDGLEKAVQLLLLLFGEQNFQVGHGLRIFLDLLPQVQTLFVDGADHGIEQTHEMSIHLNLFLFTEIFDVPDEDVGVVDVEEDDFDFESYQKGKLVFEHNRCE